MEQQTYNVGDVRRRKKMAEQLREQANATQGMVGEVDTKPIVTRASGAFPGMVQANWAGPLAKLGTAWMARSARQEATAEEEGAEQARQQALQQVLGRVGDKPPTFSDIVELQELGIDAKTSKDFLPKAPERPNIAALLQAGTPVKYAMALGVGEELTPEQWQEVSDAQREFRMINPQNRLDVQNLRNQGNSNVQGQRGEQKIEQILTSGDVAANAQAQKQQDALALAEFKLNNNRISMDELKAEAAAALVNAKTPEEIEDANAMVSAIHKIQQKPAKPRVIVDVWKDGDKEIPQYEISSLSPTTQKKLFEQTENAAASGATADSMWKINQIAKDPATFSAKNQVVSLLGDLASSDNSGVMGLIAGALAKDLSSPQNVAFRTSAINSTLGDLKQIGGQDTDREMRTLMSKYADTIMDQGTVLQLTADLGRLAQKVQLANLISAKYSQGDRMPSGAGSMAMAEKILSGKVENPFANEVNVMEFTTPSSSAPPQGTDDAATNLENLLKLNKSRGAAP